MNEELLNHFNNIVFAVEKFVGTKQDHINLEISLNAIKKKLFDEENTSTVIDNGKL
jgi:vacuolar-type H+-ATPase subunit C/Vma6